MRDGGIDGPRSANSGIDGPRGANGGGINVPSVDGDVRALAQALGRDGDDGQSEIATTIKKLTKASIEFPLNGSTLPFSK